VRQFPTTFAQRLREEYPPTGRFVTQLFRRATRSEETIGGAHRVILRISFTPDEWSTFLDRLLAL
jgi:hypothetical protein